MTTADLLTSILCGHDLDTACERLQDALRAGETAPSLLIPVDCARQYARLSKAREVTVTLQGLERNGKLLRTWDDMSTPCGDAELVRIDRAGYIKSGQAHAGRYYGVPCGAVQGNVYRVYSDCGTHDNYWRATSKTSAKRIGGVK